MKPKSPPPPGTGVPHEEHDAVGAGEDAVRRAEDLDRVLDCRPTVILDGSADLVSILYDRGGDLLAEDIDHQVAALKLQSLGVRIDALTVAQTRHLDSWSDGA